MANFVLVDEINRAPAKVQSALLEVMAERHVTIGGQRFDVPQPFLVLATQNPIESEGVYPLPEAQRDRFLMKITVDYPTAAEEREIVYRMGVEPPTASAVIGTDELLRLQETAGRVFVHHAIVDYVVRLVVATRQPAQHGMPDVASWISYGASPRASLGLIAASRALALLRGRDYVLPQDVLDIATTCSRTASCSATTRSPTASRPRTPCGASCRPSRCRRCRRASAPAARPRSSPARRASSRLSLRPGPARRTAGSAAVGRTLGMSRRTARRRRTAARRHRPRPGARPRGAPNRCCAGSSSPCATGSTACCRATTSASCPGRAARRGSRGSTLAGDDVRRMDWPVTARTTTPHVRQTIADRELETWLVVDLSPSLDFGTALAEKRELVARRDHRGRAPDGARRQPGRRDRRATARTSTACPALAGRAHARHLVRRDREHPAAPQSGRRPGARRPARVAAAPAAPARAGRRGLGLPRPRAGRARRRGSVRCARCRRGTSCSASRCSTRASSNCPPPG